METTVIIALLGIDLAKNLLALHGLDATGHTALKRPAVPRAKLVETVASLPPCTGAMESRSGACTATSSNSSPRSVSPRFA
jgi:transposase